MRLHRYFKDNADTTLREKRLLLKKISDFNDPFEFAHILSCNTTVDRAEMDLASWSDEDANTLLASLYPLLPDGPLKEKTPRRRVAELFSRIGKNCRVYPEDCHILGDKYLRICCFSKTDVTSDSEVLLWSHYADKHQGVRIEFELDEKLLPLAEVKYSGNRCVLEILKANDGVYTNDFLNQTFRTKSRAWEYEREVRLILKRGPEIDEDSSGSSIYYIQFEPSWVKSVDFGINCGEETIENVSTILRMEYPEVTLRKAFHHPEKYSIEYRPLGQ